MYKLLNRVEDGIKPMLEVLQNYITNTGFEAVKSLPAKDQKVIPKIVFFL
jgi:iron uptake system EfeUOB component EfeO/EfeM